MKDGQIYPYALRRAEYRRRYFKENSIDYSIDLNKEFKPYSYYPKYYFQFGLYAKWLKRFYDCFDDSNINYQSNISKKATLILFAK